MKMSKTSKKLKAAIATAFTLGLCLAITTAAIVMVSLKIENNIFGLGKVSIDLNGGNAVIQKEDFLFEAGATIKKDFYIKNNSTCDVYYKLYFSDVKGDLSDFLVVTILDGNKTVMSGKMNDFTRDTEAVDSLLSEAEVKNLSIEFHLPETIGNIAQARFLTFDFCAEAVQSKNNPERQFK